MVSLRRRSVDMKPPEGDSAVCAVARQATTSSSGEIQEIHSCVVVSQDEVFRGECR